MKLAVLADIHGNWQALEAVEAHIAAWRPDVVWVAGDVVNRGPESARCLARTRALEAQAGWRVIRGNHEDYVRDWNTPETRANLVRRDLHQLSWWTYQQLGASTHEIDGWPDMQADHAPDGARYEIWHASRRNNRDSIFPAPRMPDAEVRPRLGDAPPPLLLVGHTHVPLIRRVDDTLIVNCGSVGLPFDHDVRACYAQLTWRRDGWQAELARVPYDHAGALAAYADTGYSALPLSRVVQHELQHARSALFHWAVQYEPRITAGELSTERAVAEFLGGD